MNTILFPRRIRIYAYNICFGLYSILYDGWGIILELFGRREWNLSSKLKLSDIGSSGSTTVPSWITIDPNTGKLTVSAPSVEDDTEYDFYITSLFSGTSALQSKLIKLTVTNCQKWQSSYTSISLGITVSCAVIATFVITALNSLLNSASMSSFWLLVNQIQMLQRILLFAFFFMQIYK